MIVRFTLDGGLELLLNDAVQLVSLARCQLNGPVRMRVGQAVDGQVLLRRRDTAGHANTDHKRKRFFQPLTQPLLAQVTVILLVYSVELGQFGVPGGRGGNERW